ncbi:MAG TPA: hypothetical protein DEH78_15155 [Solibacterales bacterium]|nr:hypothetical protein [Bryobacterales bacterium]
MKTSWRAAALVPILLTALSAQRFRPDDPIQAEPAPKDIGDLKRRSINQYYDFYRNQFTRPGQDNGAPGGPFAAQSVNTLGEVLDSAWFTNRTLTHEQIVQGPNRAGNEPDRSKPWTVVGAKSEGVTPGLQIIDAKGRRYLLKFDPVTNPEMATGADVVSAKLLHAIGYWVPENYIVHFQRSQLVVGQDVEFVDQFTRRRKMKDRDINELLLRVPRTPGGRSRGEYRAVASLFVPGKPIGPFKFYGRRQADSNDFIPHEHRRELRGYHAICAWLGHHDSRSINTLDVLMNEDGKRYVRHYLIDFGSTLGSAATKSKSAREGNAYLYDFKSSAANLLSFGFYFKHWETAKYPYYPSIGRIEWKTFDPEEWVPNYPNRAFLNRLPEDNFWAAKRIMRFTDRDLQAVAARGEYSDKDAEKWLAEALIKRRDTIGRVYFQQVLPLDDFRIEDGRLRHTDLMTLYRLGDAAKTALEWHAFDNATGALTPIAGASSDAVPEGGEFTAARFSGPDGKKKVTVFLRRQGQGHRIVGIERTAQ